MSIEDRLIVIEKWKEQFYDFSYNVMQDSKNKSSIIDTLIKEVFELKATVQVLSEEVALLRKNK